MFTLVVHSSASASEMPASSGASRPARLQLVAPGGGPEPNKGLGQSGGVLGPSLAAKRPNIGEASNFNFSYTLPYTSLGANDSYYVLRLQVYEVETNSDSDKIYLSYANFSIQQALPPGNYNTGISTANIWNSASGTAIQGVTLTNILDGGFTASIANNLLFTTQSFLVNMFDSNNLIQKSISGSGFNQIELPFSLKLNDEFKFEGKENQTYTVIQAQVISASGASSPPTGPVSGSILVVELDKPLPASGSLNYSQFSIKRFVDDEGRLIFKGFKPTSDGPFIITPEFVVPKLSQDINEILTDLNNKGLIT